MPLSQIALLLSPSLFVFVQNLGLHLATVGIGWETNNHLDKSDQIFFPTVFMIFASLI